MALQLKTITFNHDPLSASTSALNIRRNKDFEVAVPEYDAAIPRTPAESCAAYAKLETTGSERNYPRGLANPFGSEHHIRG